MSKSKGNKNSSSKAGTGDPPDPGAGRVNAGAMAVEPRYREILDSLPLLICRFLPDSTITFVNRAYADYFGKSADELTGSRFLSLIPEPARGEVMDRILELTPEKPEMTHEHRVIGPDGEIRWQRWTNRALFDDSGKICRYQAIGEDITGQRAVQDALKTSEIRYRAMMESMTDQVYICSPDRVVEYANSAMRRRLGRDPSGEKCYRVLYDLDEVCGWCIMAEVLKGGHQEFTIVSPKDNRTYRMTNMPIQNQDDTVSMMTVCRDITDYLVAVEERKRTQARLRQAQKMEAIGTMAGGIAHDFNNILTAILGYAQLSMAQAGEDTGLKKDIREILTAGERARDLIQQILTFARQSEETLSPVRVDLIAKEVLQLVRSTLPSSIEIRSEIDTRSRIMGNVSQVHQIFMNLITNAAFAMEEKGGILRLGITETSPGDQKESADLKGERYICIRVSDTGVGIPPELIKSVFEPYFTTKPKGEGTGMGLAVVHGIVEKYGGKICIQSKPGKGSEFIIFLPVNHGEREKGGSAELDIPPGKEAILFVDDELPIVNVAERMLKSYGYFVASETSSYKALERFRSDPQQFDMVITDMTMPEMSGDRMAVEMLKIRPDLPVILCTGYSKKISGKRAEELGIKAFFRKPIDFGKLGRIIRKILDRPSPAG